MFVDGQFGGRKDDMNHTDSVVFNDGTVEFYFAPQHEPVEVMKSLLSEADHSALFMVFSMTHPELSDALIDLHADGVEVAGVLDKGQANPWYSKDEVLAEAGVPIYLDGNENAIGFAGGKLHHKALIVDAGTGSDPFVVTGSFNWSKSADTKRRKPHRDSGPQIVNAYKERWCQMFTEGNIQMTIPVAERSHVSRVMRLPATFNPSLNIQTTQNCQMPFPIPGVPKGT